MTPVGLTLSRALSILLVLSGAGLLGVRAVVPRRMLT